MKNSFFKHASGLTSLSVSIWYPQSTLKLLGTSIHDKFYNPSVANHSTRFLRSKYWPQGHIAIDFADAATNNSYYISWYPVHDLKRQATGYFYSPAEDKQFWGLPDTKYTFEVKATKAILEDTLCPLFMSYKPKGLREISLDLLSVDDAKDFSCFTINESKLFVLYRPYFDRFIFSDPNNNGQQPRTVIFDHNEAREDFLRSLGSFNFARVTEPYRAAHELPLFLLHKMGMGFLAKLPGVYNGNIDLKQFETMLINAQPAKQCSAIKP